MLHAWLQCTSGASGDMLLGALLDAGASIDVVREAVGAVATEGITIEVEKVRRAGLSALKAHVGTAETHHHRGWGEVRTLIEQAGPGLTSEARARALRVFELLARAEGRAHAMSPEDVHFHEVGALDAIADVVGVCAALESLGIDRVHSSAVALGSGTVMTSHGRLPVPVPAVLELFAPAHVPVTSGAVVRELCTPTGAALLVDVVDEWGDLPAMVLTGAGVGAGSADTEEQPNVVRVVLGTVSDAAQGAPVPSEAVVLSANVDDLDPRAWPHVLADLLAGGADDAWLTPVLMKKGRPAHVLSAMTSSDRAAGVREVMYRQTTTIGVRETAATKHALRRTESTVELDGESVRVKQAWLHGELVTVQPEYDDVVAVARRTGAAVAQVQERARSLAQQCR